MARTALVPTVPTSAGVNTNAVAADATNGMTVAWSASLFLHVKTSGTACNVTIRSNVTTSDGLVLPDRVVAMPATGEKFIGPFNPRTQHAQNDGTLFIDFSVATGVTVEAVDPHA